MSNNPFYSIGARMIDTEGRASLKVIQIQDDNIVCSPEVKCLESVSCDKNITVEGSLTVQGNSSITTETLDISAAGLAKASYTYNTVNADHFVVATQQGLNNPVRIDLSSNGCCVQATAEQSCKLTNNVTLNVDNLTFLGTESAPTQITGNLLLSSLYQTGSIGSLYLLYCIPKYGSVPQEWIWSAGQYLEFDREDWYISAKDTNNVSRTRYFDVYWGSLFYQNYSFKAHQESIISRDYKFYTLTPIKMIYSYSVIMLALRIA